MHFISAYEGADAAGVNGSRLADPGAPRASAGRNGIPPMALCLVSPPEIQ
jgi:hypothetical protein